MILKGESINLLCSVLQLDYQSNSEKWFWLQQAWYIEYCHIITKLSEAPSIWCITTYLQSHNILILYFYLLEDTSSYNYVCI